MMSDLGGSHAVPFPEDPEECTCEDGCDDWIECGECAEVCYCEECHVCSECGCKNHPDSIDDIREYDD